MARTRKTTSRAETRTQSADEFVRLVGQRLRQVRQERGMSQGQIAEALGITTGAVSAYENGTNEISTGRLKEIADVLRVSVVTLVSTGEDIYIIDFARTLIEKAQRDLPQILFDNAQDSIIPKGNTADTPEERRAGE